MNKYLIIILTLLFFNSCLGKTNSQSKDKQEISASQSLSIDECSAKLKTLIVTSVNFDNPFKKELSTRINKDDDINHTYTIELYVYDSGKNSENTVGWIKLDIKNNLLIDITKDPDEGTILQYDQKLYDEYLLKCLDLKASIKKVEQTNKNKELKLCTLPFDFDEYYNACYNSSNVDKCKQNYPKYLFSEESSIARIIKDKYNPLEYMFLPSIHGYQVVILCNTGTDVETYNLLVIDNNQIISSLEIGKISETSIMDFNISEDYFITLYKRKPGEDNRVKWELFKIDDSGKIDNVSN